MSTSKALSELNISHEMMASVARAATKKIDEFVDKIVDERGLELTVPSRQPVPWKPQSTKNFRRLSYDKRSAWVRRRSPEPKPFDFRVRCSGELHEVTVHYRGRVTFHRHSRQELRALRVFDKLGDKQCGCIDVIKWLADLKSNTRKPELNKLLRDCDNARSARNEAKPHRLTERLSGAYLTISEYVRSQLADRGDNINEAVRQARFNLAAYPGATSVGPYKNMGPESGYSRIDFTTSAGPCELHPPSCMGQMRMNYAKSGAWKPESFDAEFRLPLLWPCWWRGGIGVVEGMVVLDLPGRRSTWTLPTPPDHGLHAVLAVVQDDELGRPRLVRRHALLRRELILEKKTWPTPTQPADAWRIAHWLDEHVDEPIRSGRMRTRVRVSDQRVTMRNGVARDNEWPGTVTPGFWWGHGALANGVEHLLPCVEAPAGHASTLEVSGEDHADHRRPRTDRVQRGARHLLPVGPGVRRARHHEGRQGRGQEGEAVGGDPRAHARELADAGDDGRAGGGDRQGKVQREEAVNEKPGIYPGVPMRKYLSTNALGASHLEWLSISPLRYRHMVAVGGEDDTEATVRGTAVHTAVLEPHLFDRTYGDDSGLLALVPEAASPRATKIYKEGRAALEAAGKVVLKADEYARVRNMAAAVLANPIAAQALKKAPEREVTALWDRDGMLCKARGDALGEGLLVDLKTTKDLRGFSPWVITKLGYYRRGAWYKDGLARLGRKVEHVIFIAVESEPPHDVGVFALDQAALDCGTMECDNLVALLKQCQESGEWPGMFTEMQAGTVSDQLSNMYFGVEE